MSARRARRWPLRLVEFSPLVTGALLVAVFFSVPFPLAMQLIMQRNYPSIRQGTESPRDDELVAEQYFAMRQLLTQGESPGPQLGDRFRTAVYKSYSATARYQRSFFPSETPRAYPISADATCWAPIAAFERTEGARVSVCWVPDPPIPRILASAETAPSYLPSSGALTGESPYFPPGSTGGPKRYASVFEWLWATRRPPMQGSAGLGSPSGGGYKDYALLDMYQQHDGRVYYYAVLGSTKLIGGRAPGPIEMLARLDPEAKDIGAQVRRLAKAMKVNAYVAGPLDLRLVPLRRAAQAADPSRVCGTVWPRYSGQGMGLTRLPRDARDASAGEWYVTIDGSQPQGEAFSQLPPVAPQYFVYTAVWESRPPMPGPEVRLTPTARALLDLRVFVASRFVWMLMLGSGLFAASLVASPAAFVYERKRAAQERVLAEMARVQRDAHDKVYNRLSALSKRVSMASESITRETSRTLDQVAEDIRGTVTDLQEILGDANRETVELAGDTVLVSQLEKICAAQAARHDMKVAFEPAGEVPATPPSLGWDLQCILEEALNNAAEHGEARTARVTLSAPGPASLRLIVADDGAGMHETHIDALPPASQGLRGMRERVRRAGGGLSITSSAEGTTLTVEVPLPR